MNPLADIVLKVSLILSTAIGLSMALRGKSAALRHWVLSVGIVCAVSAPLLVSVAPVWQAPIAAKVARPPQNVPLTASPSEGVEAIVPGAKALPHGQASGAVRQISVWQLLISAWIGGALIALAALTLGLARLSWIRSRARRLDDGMWPMLAREIAQVNGIRRPITLMHSDHPSLLFTWGFLRPIVVLPRDAGEWSLDRARIVLCHELAHVGRADWLILLAAELLRAAYWFNPLTWMIGKRLRDESERACDDEVMSQGVEGTGVRDRASGACANSQRRTSGLGRRAGNGAALEPREESDGHGEPSDQSATSWAGASRVDPRDAVCVCCRGRRLYRRGADVRVVRRFGDRSDGQHRDRRHVGDDQQEDGTEI